MTEYELIKGCMKNGAICQRLLFEQYAGTMMTLCNRYSGDHTESEDILQEGFIRIYGRVASGVTYIRNKICKN